MKTHIFKYKIAFAFFICLIKSVDAQTALFSEDFTNAADWKYLNFSGSANNAWMIVNSSGCSYDGSSLTIRQNSTNYCLYQKNQQVNKLAYHLVDAVGYKNITLTLQWKCGGEKIGANYHDYGSILYSLDGHTWNKLTSGGDGNGNYALQPNWTLQNAISLPSVLNNKLFYLAFDWINDNDNAGTNPPFAVDNIVVNGETSDDSVLLTESFSSGNLPADWVNLDNSGNNAGAWEFNNPCSRNLHTGTSDNGFAIFDSNCYGNDGKAEDASLITPPINCSLYGHLVLFFTHYYKHAQGSKGEIFVSTDGGTNWISVKSYTSTTIEGIIDSVDISAVAARDYDVKIKFTYTGNNDRYWALDDIRLSGKTALTYTWTGTINSNWVTSTNWSPTGTPTEQDDVLIPAGVMNMPVIGASTYATCFNLTINTGSTLTNLAADGLGSFDIKGNVIVNGTLYHPGDGLIYLTGMNKTLGGNFLQTQPNQNVAWYIGNHASYSLSEDLLTGEISIEEGSSLNTNGHNIECYYFNQQGEFYLNDDTLTLSGNATADTLNDSTFHEGTGTVRFSTATSSWAGWGSGDQVVPSVTYYNLLIEPHAGNVITLGTSNDFMVLHDVHFSYSQLDSGTSAVHSNISVKGNWLNTMVPLNPMNSTIIFSGDSNQIIQTDNQPFYNVKIDDSPGSSVTMTGNMTVLNRLILEQGVITTGSDSLIILNPDTDAITSYSEQSFVNGNLERKVTASVKYFFPVGNGVSATDYHLAAIDNKGLVGVNFITASFTSLLDTDNSSMNCSDLWLTYTSVNSAGVWRLQPDAEPTGGNYDIYLFTKNFNGLQDNLFAPLKRPINSESASDWNTGNGTLNELGGEGRILSNGYALRMNLNSFSQFGIGQASTMLPIALTDFSAVLDGDQVDINWITWSEVNNDYFSIEHSTDGIHFAAIAKIYGAGMSSLRLDYHAIDHSPSTGKNYYRLKQTDFDGEISYSNIEELNYLPTIGEIEIYPNPSNGDLSIMLNGHQPTGFEIFDMTGRKVYEQQFQSTDSRSRCMIQLKDKLAQGIYVMYINDNTETIVRQLMVK